MMVNVRVRSLLLAPARRHHDPVHGEGEAGGPRPGSSGSEHQEEVPVHILEGDLGPHPGVAVRTLLGDAHLAWLPPVGPGQHSQLVTAPVWEINCFKIFTINRQIIWT